MNKKLQRLLIVIAVILAGTVGLPFSAMCQTQKIDTIAWHESRLFTNEEYNAYKLLNERGKQIVDSLYKVGVSRMENSYMALEPAYMKPGKKIKRFWREESGIIYIYRYLFWNSKTSHGFKFLSRQSVN